MATEQDAPPFTVAVEAGFGEDGVWVIDARLRFRDGPPPLGSRLLGLGRLALLGGIATEAQRGRSLGATSVRVHLEGHDQAAASVDDAGSDPASDA